MGKSLSLGLADQFSPSILNAPSIIDQAYIKLIKLISSRRNQLPSITDPELTFWKYARITFSKGCLKICSNSKWRTISAISNCFSHMKSTEERPQPLHASWPKQVCRFSWNTVLWLVHRWSASQSSPSFLNFQYGGLSWLTFLRQELQELLFEKEPV